jgi:hypothetical protein
MNRSVLYRKWSSFLGKVGSRVVPCKHTTLIRIMATVIGLIYVVTEFE